MRPGLSLLAWVVSTTACGRLDFALVPDAAPGETGDGDGDGASDALTFGRGAR